MKRMPLLSAALIIAIAATITSCKPSRVWATKDKKEKKEKKYDRDDRYDYGREERTERYNPPPPPPQPVYRPALTRLVISPTPGFTMNQSRDGRYFHRSSSGLLYWKGYDDRFFLDRNDLRRVSFSERDYDEWKRYSGQSR